MSRLFALACALLLAAFPTLAAERVALQLKWLHAYQFAGYYAAEAQGYYREAGLEVEIREGRPGMDFVGEVVSGRAQYGTGSSGLVLDRNQGLPVVALAVIFQHSPDLLMVAAGSGIATPQQLVFKRVMTNYSTPAIAAMLLNEAGSLDKFTILDQTNDLRGLIEGRVDAVAGYQTDQPFFFKERGFPIATLRPVQYGVDFYGDNLFTREEELRRHPQRAQAFRAASLKGWEYAMSHPDEMIALIQQRGSRLSAEHLRYEYGAMRPLLLQDLVELGHMNPGRWEHIADTYVRLGQLKPGYTLDGFLYDPDPSIGLDRYRAYLDAALGIAALAGCGLLVLYRFNRRLRAEVRERQRAEQRLTEAQRIARIGSWELDLVAGTGVWSDEEYRLLGYAPGSVPPSVAGFLRQVHPEDRAKIGEAVASARHSADGGYRMEYRVVLEDGSVRFMDERGRILFGDQGEVLHAIGTTLDITERKRIELALREQEAYLRTIIDHDPQCIKLLDRDGALLDMNPMGLAIIEADSLEQVRGQQVYGLVAAKDRAAFRGMVEAVFRGESCRLIFETVGLKGTLRQLETQSVPLWDSERREVRALLGVTQDVGERLKAEAQLEYLAHHDVLTGLPNRLLLTARLEHVLQQAERHPAQGAVLFLDLDGFKHVNDSLGHDIGDELLRRVCGRLRQAVRREDTVARLGGDEFTVLLEDLTDPDDAARLASNSHFEIH
jgi:PAS domain S-box-containing protein